MQSRFRMRACNTFDSLSSKNVFCLTITERIIKVMNLLIVGTDWVGKHADYTARALTKLGHKVEIYWTNKTLPKKLHRLEIRLDFPGSSCFIVKGLLIFFHKFYLQLVNTHLIEKVSKINPDMIIAFNGIQISAHTWRYLRSQERILVNWINDDPFRFPGLIKSLSSFQYIFTTDPVHITGLRLLLPGSTVNGLPLAADPDFFHPININAEDKIKYECDIVFVGSGYEGGTGGIMRAKVLNDLAEISKIRIFGLGWDQLLQEFPKLKHFFYGPVYSPTELNKIYNAAKIVLVVHHPQCKIQTNQVPFQSASAGRFVLAEKKPELVSIFGNNVAYFETLEEARELAAYYLSNPEKRHEMENNARDIVVRDHTYINRMSKMFECIKYS